MTDVLAVNRYSQAIFDLAHKEKETAKVEKDLADLSEALEGSGLQSVLVNPRYPIKEKQKVIDRLGEMMSSTLTVRFLHILLKKSRTNLIPGVAERFLVLEREVKGIVPCEVVLVEEPNKEFVKKIESALKKITGSPVAMTVRTDENIIGGVSVRIKNKILDASFRSTLLELKNTLLKAKI